VAIVILQIQKSTEHSMALQELREALANGGVVVNQDPDFIIDAIRSNLPGVVKRVQGGININCPMCVARGEPRPDTKYRCGIRFFPGGSLAINCFNCRLATRWSPGLPLNRNVRDFLIHLGINELDVKKLNFTAWKMMQNAETKFVAENPVFIPAFNEVELPKNAKTISEWAQAGETSLDFLEVAQYAISRGDDVWCASEFYWTPDTEHIMNRRVILPFYWKDKLVGYSGRLIDEELVKKGKPKYYSEVPAHYLFNNSMIDKPRKFIILVEGVFDALAIEGVATQGAKLSEQQAFWLKQSGRQIIVLPDRDKAGQKLIDLALEHDWMVSLPEWDAGIKDANDAVKTYGRLYTVRSIIDAATDNKLKINLARKRF
jgi:5S rRNA maturation endonuclease (ribonuclease M5)